MRQISHLGDRVLQFNPYHDNRGRFAPRSGGQSFANETSGRSPTSEEVVAGQAVTHINGKVGTFTGKYGNYQGKRLPEVQWSDGKRDIYDLSRLRISEEAKPVPTVSPRPEPTKSTSKTGEQFASKSEFSPEDIKALEAHINTKGNSLFPGQWERNRAYRGSSGTKEYTFTTSGGAQLTLKVGISTTYAQAHGSGRLIDDSKTTHSQYADLSVNTHADASASARWRPVTLKLGYSITGSSSAREVFDKLEKAKAKFRSDIEEKFGIKPSA